MNDVKVRMALKTMGVAAGLLAVCLSSAVSLADTLHTFGNDGTWRHEHSGWQFAMQVGEFSRVMRPYTIDGNNDVGAQYERSAAPRIVAVVEVYMSDSAATDATFEGAKTTAARKAGEGTRVRSEQLFKIGGHADIRGTKVTYTTDAAGASGAETRLYFFETRRWVVKVLGNADAPGADRVLDAFVQELPWDHLGDPSALHVQ